MNDRNFLDGLLQDVIALLLAVLMVAFLAFILYSALQGVPTPPTDTFGCLTGSTYNGSPTRYC